MTTSGYINDMPLRWLNKKVSTDIRVAKNPTPGKYGSSLDNFKEGGLEITLDVLATSKTERDSVVASFMQEGISQLGLGGIDVGWYFKGVCADRSTSLALSDYVPEEDYPLSFLFVAEDPFMYSETKTVVGTSFSASGQTWTGDTCYPFNKIQNWSFENWEGGLSGVAPDNWIGGAHVSCVARSNYFKYGEHCLKITNAGYSSPVGEIYQYLYLEKDISYTVRAWVHIENYVSGSLVIELVNNGVAVDSVTQSGTVDWTLVEFEYTFTSDPVNPCIRIYVNGTPSNSSVYRVDGVLVTETSNLGSSVLGNSITTAGTIYTVPDFQIEGVGVGTTTITGGSHHETDATNYTTSSTSSSYVLLHTYTIPATPGVGTLITAVGYSFYSSSSSYTAYSRMTIQGAGINSGVAVTVASYSTNHTSGSPDVKSKTGLHYQANVNVPVYIRIYGRISSSSGTCRILNTWYNYTGGTTTINVFPQNVKVFNAADPYKQLQMCNQLVPGSIIRVNADGTGFFSYQDSFDTTIYQLIATDMVDVTYSAANATLSIADGGDIVFAFDTKYPIVGIPHIMLFVNSGAPLLSIGYNTGLTAENFFENDSNSATPLTDQVYVASLNNASNCVLAGATNFSVAIEPHAGSSITISSIYIYCDTITIDAEHPVIYPDSNNTLQVEMDNSATCNLSMAFPDRIWGI